MEDCVRMHFWLLCDSSIFNFQCIPCGDVSQGQECSAYNGPHGHLLPHCRHVHSVLSRDLASKPPWPCVDRVRHRVVCRACRHFLQGPHDRSFPLHFNGSVHPDGLGDLDSDRSACSFFERFGDNVVGAWRRALHYRLRVLSLEKSAVPSSHMASLRVGGVDLPFLLHSLVRHVKRMRGIERWEKAVGIFFLLVK